MVTLGERLRLYRKENKLSMADISAATGLPEARLYKWEKGTTPSSYEDVKIMENYLSGKLENVPHETIHPLPINLREVSLLTQLNESYKAQIEELKDRQRELKERMANVQQLMANLEQMSENQAVMEARVELAVDLLAEVHPVLKKIQDPEEVAHALDIRFAPKLKAILKRGNHFGATGTASRS
jgi:transcriptional regulator with XRE-family HTH domain